MKKNNLIKLVPKYKWLAMDEDARSWIFFEERPIKMDKDGCWIQPGGSIVDMADSPDKPSWLKPGQLWERCDNGDQSQSDYGLGMWEGAWWKPVVGEGQEDHRLEALMKQDKKHIIDTSLYIHDLFCKFVHLVHVCLEENRIEDLKYHTQNIAGSLEMDLPVLTNKK